MLTYDDLYGWVRDLPIVDWHNHLDLKMLAEDKPLGSLYDVWVRADPYKHRVMRICGEPEDLVTGGEGEAAKWDAWMRTLPKLVGNPIFAWARMELSFLGLDPEPYLHGRGENVSLAAWTPSKMLAAFGVEKICPCLGAEQIGSAARDNGRPRPLRESDCSAARDNGRPRPLHWTAPSLRLFSAVSSDHAAHFSNSLVSDEAHRRNLPHVGHDSVLVFITFRLADSLPAAQLQTFEDERAHWMREHPKPWDDATVSAYFAEIGDRVDHWLDAGHGSCLLADERCRRIVEESLEYFNGERTSVATDGDVRCPEGGAATDGDVRCPEGGVSGGVATDGDVRCPGNGVATDADVRCPVAEGPKAGTTDVLVRCAGMVRSKVGTTDVLVRCAAPREPRYVLHGYIVMPNHVHVLVELIHGADMTKVVQGWKSFSARKINEVCGTTGTVWREEYYDRLIRDEGHYRDVLAYLKKNEAAAHAIAEQQGMMQRATDGDVRCPGDDAATDGDVRCPGDDAATDGDVRCPGDGAATDGDVRCPDTVPSLRMNAGDRIAADALARFEAAGCRVVDISVDDSARLETEFDSLAAVAAFAAAHGWTMLLHLGALRETSARLRAAAGPAGGFAGMRAPVDPADVARFLNRLESGAALPRTVLLSLNPEAHAQLAVLAGSFNGAGMPGKVQLGPAWWWCDHEEGIRDVFEKNAAYGVLSAFVGMTTDSRSLLSFVRHDYFRRILCRWTAEKVAAGAFPDDAALLRPMLENICYRNARGMVSRGDAEAQRCVG